MLLTNLFAHAGHGTSDPESVSHLFLESQHNWLIIAVIALGALVVWAGKRKPSKAPKAIRKESNEE